MNILIVSHLYPTPNNTVTGIFVHRQVQALAERGHEVQVISPTPYVPDVPYLPNRWALFRDTPNRAQIDGIDVEYPRYVSLPSRHTLPLVAISFRQCVSSAIVDLTSSSFFSPDVINAHVPLPDGYACLPASHRIDVPLVTTVHGASIQKSSKNRLCRRQIESVFEHSDEIVFNSKVLRSKAQEYFSDLEQANIVPNGVPLLEIEAASPANLPDTFSADRLVVTSLGSLNSKKGQRDVFEALRRVSVDSQPNYLLIGDGPDREALEQKAEELESPVYFTGNIPPDNVYSYLKAADIMALPSTEEAFGIAYIEAMACGSPVIGCEGEGPSDFVEHGKTGYLVPPNEPDTIANIVQHLSDNRTKIEQMGDKAREYVLENLTWAENARQNEEIYQDAIEHF